MFKIRKSAWWYLFLFHGGASPQINYSHILSLAALIPIKDEKVKKKLKKNVFKKFIFGVETFSVQTCPR